jgi:lipopolysaccharide export system protein LptA
MFQPVNKSLMAASLFLVCMFCAQAGFAENADRDKPINLEADKVLLDDARKVSTFTGNVRLSQGTLSIRGDKIVVDQDKDGFKQAIIDGKTAEFRQKQEGLDTFVEGSGERIEYDSRTETMDIHGQAYLKRGLDEVRGDHITYSTKTEVFQVSGGKAGAGDAPPQRVHAILQPKSKKNTAVPTAPGATIVVPDNSLPPKKEHE